MTHNTLPARRSRLVPLAALAAAVALAAGASAGAASSNGTEPQTSTAAATTTSKATVKSLAKQVKKLTKRIAVLEQKKFPDSLPPSGPARGDLAGSYPNPTIAPNAVGPAKIPDETLTGFEIAPDSLFANDLASNSVGAAELKVTHTVTSNGVSVGAGAIGTATVACPAGEVLTGGGHSWLNDGSSRIVYSTPVEFGDARMWTVQGSSVAANTLFAWAVCLPA
jgi:hypothetical protein